MTSLSEALGLIDQDKRAFQLTFEAHQPANQKVLRALARYCRANESCVVPGDRDRTLLLEGRREVWLFIQQYLSLTPEQLLQLFNWQRSPTKGNEQ